MDHLRCLQKLFSGGGKDIGSASWFFFSLYWCHLVNKFIQHSRSFLKYNNWRFWITSKVPSILYCLEALWSTVSFPRCESWRRLLLTLCSLFHMTNNQLRKHWRRRLQILYVLLTPWGMFNRCLFSSLKPYNCLSSYEGNNISLLIKV